MDGKRSSVSAVADQQRDRAPENEAGGQAKRDEILVETENLRQHVASSQDGSREQDAHRGPAWQRTDQGENRSETKAEEKPKAPDAKGHGMADHRQATFGILMTGQTEKGGYPITQKSGTRRGQEDNHTRQAHNQ